MYAVDQRPTPRTHESPSTPKLRTQAAISTVHAEPPSPRPKKRRLSESDSDSPRAKYPRGMEGGRLHAVSDPLTESTAPTWFNFDQSFQIPDPASTGPLGPSEFDVDFFDPSCLPLCATSSISGESASILQTDAVLTSSYKAPSSTVAVPTDGFSSLFEIPQLDHLQPELPTFDCDWTEFLNFEPDLSLFPFSSPTSSLASTPPLVDDAILSPSSPSDNDPSSPDPFLDILPHLNEKCVQSPVRVPLIQGQDFLLPPGEDAGIPSIIALLSTH